MCEAREEDNHSLNPRKRGNSNGKACIEFFGVELIKAVKAARAVLEEAEENQLAPISPQSALNNEKRTGNSCKLSGKPFSCRELNP